MGDEQKEEQQEELKPDLAGYPSVEALVNGYRESGKEAKKWRELAERHQREGDPANQRQAIPDRSQATATHRLMDYGIPEDLLDEFVNQRLEKAFQPIAASMTARSTVLSQYPDFVKFEQDVAQFLESDPRLNETYQRMFNADPAAAMEYAFLKFGDSRRRAGGERQRPPEIDQEAAHAAVPGSRSGGGERRPDAQDNDIRRAWEQFQKTGSSRDAEAYAKARLKTVIKDEFLNQ